MQTLRRPRDLRPAVLLLAAATVLAYWHALHAGYVWDDDLYLTENPVVADPWGFARLWTAPETPQYPLVFLSFWLQYRIHGLHPFGYHLVNVALHAANALLVWQLAARLGLRWGLAVAFLFALHPVHVESVAWVTERKNLMSGLGCLLAMRAYLRFDERREGGDTHAWRSYAAVIGWYAFALLSKTV